MNDVLFKSSFSDFIIAFLLSSRSTKIMRRVLRDRLKARGNFNSVYFNQNIYRLKKRGLINLEGDTLYFNKNSLRKNIKISFIRAKPGDLNKLIMIFDIPEVDRRLRDWLRGQIKLWNFKMIQKSVWLGSGPLPTEFNDKIKYLGIDKNIKIFNIQKK